MSIVRDSTDNLATFTSTGMAKQFSLTELPLQARGGKGIKIGDIAAVALISNEDNLLVCGAKNSICISAKDIPTLGRTAQGNQVIKGDRIISVSKI